MKDFSQHSLNIYYTFQAKLSTSLENTVPFLLFFLVKMKSSKFQKFMDIFVDRNISTSKTFNQGSWNPAQTGEFIYAF